LVKIGSVVLEKIFFKLHPPFFLFLAWQPPWLEVGITGHKFGRGIKIFSSETTGPLATKLSWNGPWMAPFQNCVGDPNFQAR
jgi:hypothetical protein